MKKTVFISWIVLLSSLGCRAQSVMSQYKIVNTFPVTGDGGWDYLTLDEAGERLFLSHSSIVQVMDTKSGKILATIPDTKGVHGITLASDLGKGFISNGKDNSVTVFDLKTYAVIEKIAITGKNPDAILYDPFSQLVFVFNGASNNANVIDAKKDSVIKTIAMPGRPEFSVTDRNGKVYVNVEDKNLVCMIDVPKLKIEKQWSTLPGESPSGLTIDNKNHRLFTVCGDNKLMMILDASNGAVIGSVPIGANCDGVAFDAQIQKAYSSNGDGTVTVVVEKSGKYQVLETVATHKGARTIAVDSKTHHLYLPCAEFGPAPQPTNDHPHPRPTIKDNSFMILDIAPKG